MAKEWTSARMGLEPFLIEPASLSLPWTVPDMPVGVVDLDRADDDGATLSLPPFPVVGIGDGSHPLAVQLDVVIEPGFVPATLIDSICARPATAAMAVQLLRLLDGLPYHAGLVAESLTYAALQASSEHRAWLKTHKPALPAAVGEVLAALDGDQLTVTMIRPDAGNAIDQPMRDGLREAFELAALDRSIRKVMLRGAGSTFSLGADLAEFGTTRDPATAHAIRMRTLPAHAIAGCASRLEAHVDGACVGAGLEMAAFSARITATRRAWFHLPELAMGIVPGAGGCVSLPRRIGRQRTALLLLSGRRIRARTALAWGLIDAIVDDLSANQGRPDIVGEQP